jgi:hypothetical protein
VVLVDAVGYVYVGVDQEHPLYLTPSVHPCELILRDRCSAAAEVTQAIVEIVYMESLHTYKTITPIKPQNVHSSYHLNKAGNKR